VLRAANLIASRAGVEPFGSFQLDKRIPSQAGMGGGSSDAAAALKLANVAWGINYSTAKLSELAAELGSDVPFFVSQGITHSAAICRGRGERIEPVGRLPRLNFVVVKPTIGASTAEVFEKFSKQGPVDRSIAQASRVQLQSLVQNLRLGHLAAAARDMKNRLETVVLQWHEQINQIHQRLAESNCFGHFVTGSGSACVGVTSSARGARREAGLLAGMNLGSVFATASC